MNLTDRNRSSTTQCQSVCTVGISGPTVDPCEFPKQVVTSPGLKGRKAQSRIWSDSRGQSRQNVLWPPNSPANHHVLDTICQPKWCKVQCPAAAVVRSHQSVKTDSDIWVRLMMIWNFLPMQRARSHSDYTRYRGSRKLWYRGPSVVANTLSDSLTARPKTGRGRGRAVGWSMAPIEPFSNQCWLKIGVIRYIIRRSKRPAGSGVLGLPKNHP